QVAMVEPAHHAFPDRLLHVVEVDDHPGRGVNRPAKRHLEVVRVAVEASARPEDAVVLLIGPVFSRQHVARFEPELARDQRDTLHHLTAPDGLERSRTPPQTGTWGKIIHFSSGNVASQAGGSAGRDTVLYRRRSSCR